MAFDYPWETGIIGAVPPVVPAPEEYRPVIDKGDFDALEAMAMGRIDEAPGNVLFLLPAYRAFVKKKQNARAEVLLQLHIETLRQMGDVAAETTLCCSVLGFWPECVLCRDALLFHLRNMYKDSPGFDRFVSHLGAREAAGLDALRLLETWLRYDEGRVVYMPSKGAGRVREVNLVLGVLRVAFENNGLMSFKIDEAKRLCRSLARDHFLSRKLANPAAMQEKAEQDPSGLLSLLFASERRTLPLAELREMLSGVVHETHWSAWWARARKDNRLTVGMGARPDISWNESAADAEAAILKQFESAAPLDKVEIMRKHAGRSSALAARMRLAVARDAEASRTRDPSLSLELALALGEPGPAAGAPLTFSLRDLLTGENCAGVVSGIRDKSARRRAAALLVDIREDWPDAFRRLMEDEADGTTLEFLYETLREKGHADVCDDMVRTALAEPESFPRLYAWLCREMPSRPELKPRADAGFLLALLRVLDGKSFTGHHAALRKLFDLGEAADWAATTLSADEAARALDLLNRDSGLEDFRKDRLREEIFHRYPHLHEGKVELVYVTKENIEAKRDELRKLVTVDLPQNSKEIQRTREYGDLRENFEYHAARARQEMLSSRAKSLQDELANTRSIDPQTVDASKISIGTMVRLREASGGAALALSILGPWDSEPSKNILSYTSAAGAGMLGAVRGATVQYNEKEYVVEEIEVWGK
jgi:transcription elongation GreA/GreB family factor